MENRMIMLLTVLIIIAAVVVVSFSLTAPGGYFRTVSMPATSSYFLDIDLIDLDKTVEKIYTEDYNSEHYRVISDVTYFYGSEFSRTKAIYTEHLQPLRQEKYDQDGFYFYADCTYRNNDPYTEPLKECVDSFGNYFTHMEYDHIYNEPTLTFYHDYIGSEDLYIGNEYDAYDKLLYGKAFTGKTQAILQDKMNKNEFDYDFVYDLDTELSFVPFGTEITVETFFGEHGPTEIIYTENDFVYTRENSYDNDGVKTKTVYRSDFEGDGTIDEELTQIYKYDQWDLSESTTFLEIDKTFEFVWENHDSKWATLKDIIRPDGESSMYARYDLYYKHPLYSGLFSNNWKD